MDPLDGVVVKCFPSATIAKLSRLLSTDVKLHNFEFIIIHVGTNNFGNRDSFGNILSDYGNLIASVKKLKSLELLYPLFYLNCFYRAEKSISYSID